MGRFNYEEEPLRDILFIDVKSFYASVECVQRGLDPLTALLVVMSHSDNTGNGLVLALRQWRKLFWGSPMSLVLTTCPTTRIYIKFHLA